MKQHCSYSNIKGITPSANLPCTISVQALCPDKGCLSGIGKSPFLGTPPPRWVLPGERWQKHSECRQIMNEPAVNLHWTWDWWQEMLDDGGISVTASAWHPLANLSHSTMWPRYSTDGWVNEHPFSAGHCPAGTVVVMHVHSEVLVCRGTAHKYVTDSTSGTRCWSAAPESLLSTLGPSWSHKVGVSVAGHNDGCTAQGYRRSAVCPSFSVNKVLQGVLSSERNDKWHLWTGSPLHCGQSCHIVSTIPWKPGLMTYLQLCFCPDHVLFSWPIFRTGAVVVAPFEPVLSPWQLLQHVLFLPPLPPSSWRSAGHCWSRTEPSNTAALPTEQTKHIHQASSCGYWIDVRLQDPDIYMTQAQHETMVFIFMLSLTCRKQPFSFSPCLAGQGSKGPVFRVGSSVKHQLHLYFVASQMLEMMIMAASEASKFVFSHLVC